MRPDLNLWPGFIEKKLTLHKARTFFRSSELHLSSNCTFYLVQTCYATKASSSDQECFCTFFRKIYKNIIKNNYHKTHISIMKKQCGKKNLVQCNHRIYRNKLWNYNSPDKIQILLAQPLQIRVCVLPPCDKRYCNWWYKPVLIVKCYQ